MSRAANNNWIEIHAQPSLSPGIRPNPAVRQLYAPPVNAATRQQYAPSSVPPSPSPTNPVVAQPPRPPEQQQQGPPMSSYILPPNPQFSQQRKEPGKYYPGIPAAFNANHPVQVVRMVKVPLGTRSTCLTCPNCRTEIYTKVEYEAGRMTHIAAVVIFLLGGLCLACLPYCANDFKDVTHECPECGMCIGVHRR